MGAVEPTIAAVQEPSAPPASERKRRLEQQIRALPIRWRIIAIAGLNTAVVLLLTALIWDGARGLTMAWDDLRQARQSDRLLVALENEAARLQGLIHRYFNQPNPDLLVEIESKRESVLDILKTRVAADPAVMQEAAGLTRDTEQLLAGFESLRALRNTISRTYEEQVLRPARELSTLYASLEGSVTREAPIWPPLSQSRDAYAAILVAANAYYLSLATDAADEALRNMQAIERSVPAMLALAETDQQRDSLNALAARVEAMRRGLSSLADNFANQSRLLRDAIDGNQAAIAATISRLAAQVRAREQAAQEHFNDVLHDVFLQVMLIAVAFLALIVAIGIAIASSISAPLRELRDAMNAIVSGDYDRRVEGIEATDEIGEMARAVEVFRGNAIAKRRAENELRASKDRAETALSELRSTQKSLIEAEKLAALGGLVAGVAHEVNNPVGISLTVASSMALRAEAFAAELEAGQLRRSRLAEFVETNRDAANQLVGNLQRAGELIQSFKQVAVDRSHEQRRQFDLQLSTEQIISSLRPGLKKSRVELEADIPEGIAMDSYPGAYGQVVTNLVLNAVTHGFADGLLGTIRLEARRLGEGQIELLVEDDGLGMSEEVQRRAFDPFFTTRRAQGGTGLGLHIVYNLVTRRLGGRITFASAPSRGTTFRITIPTVAPRTQAAVPEDSESGTER